MKIIVIVLLCPILLFSCATQKRVSQTAETMRHAKEDVAIEMRALDSTRKITEEKLADGEMDTTIKGAYDRVLNRLILNLQEAEHRIRELEQFLKSKSNFRNNFYERSIQPYVIQLDSFNVLKQKRETMYQLITEAVSIKAFSLFKMAAFFEPGVYRIPADGVKVIRDSYLPVLDSIQYLANKFSQIPRTVRFVFVGYADESPIAQGSPLYNELSGFPRQQIPSNSELNRILSQLRANEMMRNMQLLVQERASAFNSFPTLKVSYHNYGRGEQHPNPNIKNYQKNDERRRIVMFFWSVLPDIK